MLFKNNVTLGRPRIWPTKFLYNLIKKKNIFLIFELAHFNNFVIQILWIINVKPQ